MRWVTKAVEGFILVYMSERAVSILVTPIKMFHLWATLLVNSVNMVPRSSGACPHLFHSSLILNLPVPFVPCDQGYTEFRAGDVVGLNATRRSTDRINSVRGGSELHKLGYKETIIEYSLGTQSSKSSGDWVKSSSSNCSRP
jgi:hypothetical protein